MARIGRFLLLVLKIASYFALAVVAASIASVTVVELTNVCPNMNDAGLHCSVKAVEGIAAFGTGVVLITLFTGFPALFALIGLSFVVTDLLRWRRKRRAEASPGL